MNRKTSISDNMVLLRLVAPIAVNTSIPFMTRLMPIVTCHNVVAEILDNKQSYLLTDDEYNFAASLMSELANQVMQNNPGTFR